MPTTAAQPGPESPEPEGYRARIRALVDAAPPLSPRQRERLRMILAVRPRAGADATDDADRAEEGDTS